MATDPNNPAIAPPSINPDYLKSQQDIAKAVQSHNTLLQNYLALDSGVPVTESGIYLQILIACINGRVATTSDDLQVWATDLTRDFLAKYPLPTPVPPV